MKTQPKKRKFKPIVKAKVKASKPSSKRRKNKSASIRISASRSSIRPAKIPLLDSYQLWLSRQKPVAESVAREKPTRSLLMLDSMEQWLRKQPSSDAEKRRAEQQERKGAAPRNTFEEWISGQVTLLRSRATDESVAEESEASSSDLKQEIAQDSSVVDSS
jgi:hypothetical protein